MSAATPTTVKGALPGPAVPSVNRRPIGSWPGHSRLGHRLVDDGNFRPARPVGRRKRTPFHQRRADGIEELRRDLVAAEPHPLWLGALAPLDGNGALGIPSDEKLARDGGTLDPRNGTRLRAGPLEVVDALSRGWENRAGELHQQHALGVEPRIHVLDVQKTACEESGANQQHNRERELRGDQRFSKLARGRPDRSAAPAFLKGGLHPSPCHGERGRETNHDSGDERQRQRPGKCARVECDFVYAGQAGRFQPKNRAHTCHTHGHAREPGDTGEGHALD